MHYEGMGPVEGTIVEEELAFAYALERCLHGTPEDQAEFKEAFVEWYYSGNWVRVD